MPTFADFDALSFDCYGTLIDWESGKAGQSPTDAPKAAASPSLTGAPSMAPTRRIVSARTSG